MHQDLVNTRLKSATYAAQHGIVNGEATSARNTRHPLAGTRMAGADMVVQVLADEGVDTIFGYSGGAILPTYDAVFRYNDKHRTSDGEPAMPLIVPANEQGAGFMADGYARACTCLILLRFKPRQNSRVCTPGIPKTVSTP